VCVNINDYNHYYFLSSYNSFIVLITHSHFITHSYYLSSNFEVVAIFFSECVSYNYMIVGRNNSKYFGYYNVIKKSNH